MNEQHSARPTDERTCICSDPENCTQRVPGYRCKKDFMPRVKLISKGEVVRKAYSDPKGGPEYDAP